MVGIALGYAVGSVVLGLCLGGAAQVAKRAYRIDRSARTMLRFLLIALATI